MKKLVKFADQQAYLDGKDNLLNNSACAIADENGTICGYKDENGEIFLFQNGEQTDVKKRYYIIYNDGSKEELEEGYSYGGKIYNNPNIQNIVSLDLPKSSAGLSRGFLGLVSLTSLKVADGEKLYYVENMFYGCSSLTSIDFSNCVAQEPSITSFVPNNFFNCSALEEIRFPKFYFEGLSVSNCTNLKYLYIESFAPKTINSSASIDLRRTKLTADNIIEIADKVASRASKAQAGKILVESRIYTEITSRSDYYGQGGIYSRMNAKNWEISTY